MPPRCYESARAAATRRRAAVESGVGFAVGLDLDQAGAGGEGVGQVVQGVEAAVGEVEEGRGLGDVDAAGGAEQGFELVAVQRLLLGQEVEDAAAVVVDDDDPHRGRDVAQGGEAADVVEQAEVAGDDRGRPAGRVGGADAGGDQAVDPVGAAVAEEGASASVAGRKASWSRIGMLEAV